MNNVVILLVSLAVVLVTLGVMWRLGKWPFAKRESLRSAVVSTEGENIAYELPYTNRNYEAPSSYTTIDGKTTLECPSGTEWDGNGCKID